MGNGIFISYRRDSSQWVSKALDDALGARFGPRNVIKSATILSATDDQAAFVRADIKACATLIAIIGPDWLSFKNSDGVSCLDDDNDNIRLEIASALSGQVPVIAVLIDGTELPPSDSLPEDLKSLENCKALEIRSESFDADVDRLIDYLQQDLGIASDFLSIPGYRILSTIGEGGMAHVYLGVQEALEREVAIKVLASEFVADKEFCDRFVNEGKLIAKLNHPNIITIYDSGVQQDYYFLIMEYVAGGTLTRRLRKGALPLDIAINIIEQIANALEFAHRNNLIHRDVKPANILFRDDDSPVLSDFGVAKALDAQSEMTRVGMMIGTPSYMSPEQAVGGEVTPQSDLYSLGVVFYKMLTGQLPFGGKTSADVITKVMNTPVPPLPTKFEKLQPIIDKLLAKSPDQRYADAGQLITALKRYKRELGEAETKISPVASIDTVQDVSTPSAKFIRPKLFPSVVAGLTISIAIGLGAFVLLRDKPPELDPQIIAQIKELTELAEANFAMAMLTEPPGSNAYDVYVQILELDPSNENAKKGIQRIADTLHQFAQEHIDKGETGQGATLIVQGLRVQPEHKGLLKLRDRLQLPQNTN